MGVNDPRSKARKGELEDTTLPQLNASESAFYGFLRQALTLGIKRVRPSVLPQFIGFLVYVALVAFLATSLILKNPQVIAAAIILLVIVGIMATLLLMDIGKKVHPVVSNVILLLVVASFLAIIAYGVVRLLDNHPVEDPMAAMKKKCVEGSASACSELDKRIRPACGYDAACLARAQCWQDKSRALLILKRVCDLDSANYNAQGCEFQSQNARQQATVDCDSL